MTKEEDMKDQEDTSTATATVDGTDEDAFVFVEDPVFDIDYKGDCAYEVKVSIPAANAESQKVEMLDELRQHTDLPGFRRGRAPLKLLERKFGKILRNDVNGKLVNAAFDKLVRDEDLKPTGFPDVDGLDDTDKKTSDGPLDFTLKFEVNPRVELGKYRGVEVERPVVKVDDEDVEESINALLERHATYEVVEDEKAIEGDQIVIDFSGTVDGEEFEGGAAENYPYILGSKRFFPEFEKKLLGSKTGSKLKCIVTFPDDYFSAELQGKKADFKIKVNEIKRKQLPKLSAKFAKENGFEGVKDLREKTQARLAEASEGQSMRIAESRALEAVIESSTYEVSKSLIEALAREHTESEVRRLMQARVPNEQIESQMKTIEEQAGEGALRSVKTLTTLNEIGQAEDIEVTEEDFEKEAEQLSKSIGADVEMVAQYMAQGDQRGSYYGRIYRSKALAVIMDNAKITDKELSREEMNQAEESDDAKGE